MNAFAESQQISSKPTLESTTRAALLVFALEGQRYALPLEIAERVVPAVAVTSISQAPATVLGVINLHGEIVPVISGRKWFGWPERPVRLSDRMIIARMAGRKLALLVDDVIGVAARTGADEVRSNDLLPGLGSLASVVKGNDGLILLHHLDDLGLLARQIQPSQPGTAGTKTS